MAEAIKLLFVIYLYLEVVHLQHSVQSTCLTNNKGVNPRHIAFRGNKVNLTLQTNNRVGQRLVTEILKIIIEDSLNYENVRIVESNDIETKDVLNNWFANTSGPSGIRGYDDAVPNAMVNLQLMITPDQDLTQLIKGIGNLLPITELGISVPQGRFGWFIPEKLSKVTDGYEHWRLFRDPLRTTIFDLAGEDRLLHNYSMDANGRYFCSNSNCKNGYFIPQQCRNLAHNQSCAILLSSYPETTDFVIGNIIDLKLYIKVLWLGPNLRIAVDRIADNYVKNNISKSVVFLEWAPGYFTVDRDKLVSVALPDCEILKWQASQGCKYELTNTVKIIWSAIENLAPSIMFLAHQMHFNRTEYSDLLSLHYAKAGKKSTYDTACTWLKTKKEIWNSWLKPEIGKKKNLILGGIYPLSETYYSGYGIASAAMMAQQDINANSSILRDYNLELRVTDGGCNAKTALESFIHYMHVDDYARTIGILGPACSETVDPLAGLTTTYSIIVMSYSADGSNLDSKYPYFFRTIGENKQYIMVYLQLFKKMGWSKFGTLSLDGQKHTEYISVMEDFLQKNGVNTTVNVKVPNDGDMEYIDIQLSRLKKSRIIITDMYDSLARKVMCSAYKQKMTLQDGYVWFLPSWLDEKWYNTTHFNKFENETIDCSVENMLEAINGTFMLSYAQYAEDDDITPHGTTVRQWKKDYQAQVDTFGNAVRNNAGNFLNLEYYVNLKGYNFSSIYASYAYDAVWAYALAVDKLITNYSSDIVEVFSSFLRDNTTVLLNNLLYDTDFHGVSGHIKFYGTNSRYPIINVLQMQHNGAKIVGKFTPNITKTPNGIVDGNLELDENSIVWLTTDGKRPVDAFDDDCFLYEMAQFFDISCSEAVIVLNVLIFTLFGIVLIGTVYLIKRRYEQKMKLTRDYMRAIGLDKHNGLKMTNLDKWEIPREKVVINRSIGNGAFGTVYGGEALLNENEGWVSVAVKMLQFGATTDQKLDFLSEAESMKRFNHKNIVKLLGVCTKNEPVYTIMEFMLYGDLKTYLLARRDLVKARYTEESSEISSKRLTSMALDVARALSYLAQLKYVHRDVACRNCLVNSQRVVKLGDFGMTRLIFESDYYRFSRKGMLPVRWMAPESLGLGIFTLASDVWSFGVLLYEIITFGSFPFQGYSNNEVLERVKNGNILTIPNGVKPQLEGLMKSCWSREYTQRPQISEIADFLASNPHLLTPCLDVPLSSVELDCSTSFNMLPEIINRQNMRRKSNLINLEPRVETPTTSSPILNQPRQFDNLSYVVVENKKKEKRKNGFKTNELENDESEPFVSILTNVENE